MNVPAELLMIRHGQTAWNKMKRLQGHSDIPLNEKGLQQAIVLGETLSKEPLDAIFSSDLQRALRTAEEIARWHNLPVQIDPNLRERSYGVFEGLHPVDIEKLYPESHAAWHAADPDHVFPPGEREAESLRQFYKRALDTVMQIGQAHAGKKVAIVAHFGIIESSWRFTQGIRPEDFARMPVLNTSINRFQVHGNDLRLIQWADAEHLEPLESVQQPVDYLKHY